MSFDQSTRNRLQRFVSSARALLVEEFTRQLQANYGLDPGEGAVADMASLTHLDNRQRQTAHLLRETLAHYLVTTGTGDQQRTQQALGRIIREQAFTVLNRLAALRMAEARGFLLESVAKSYSSKGFQLYKPMAGTAHGETGDAYRNYLFSLFDEFSLDLAVLFDRHSAQGQLFPRESALLALLDEINHPDIEHLWAEDETIGWIYQYFNSQEERRQMRAESQSPRNSRELAVRNQFFTPRYVVEFLTDNTLGRIWYEMTQGNTALVDNCRYLVRRPTEIFLKPNEAAPESPEGETESLSQEELLQQPVYIPHRPLKDPRSIRMLDPACGSMHFGLYAFDLFERIYREAWQLEQQLGPDAFIREEGQDALQNTYANWEEFEQQIPKLIIEHNIHGVDIDPRAVQIAGLSLWQRAQRTWHQQGIKPQQRPAIVKSNIVCAEPMPGEKTLLQEFTEKLHPPVLGQLLEVIFDKMQLAGEAGTLLKIEEEMQTAIQEAREQWLKESGSNTMGDMFPSELDAATPQKKLGFDLRGIDNETFWDDAEQHILQALSDYADKAESSADQKRLFAEDTAKGFAFIELCRKRFDVVLMNPPFGEPAINTRKYLYKNYKFSTTDILIAFLERANEVSEITAALSNRTPFFLKTFQGWRDFHLFERDELYLFADLGDGVLDAMVEAAAYVMKNTKTGGSIFLDCRLHKEKASDLLGLVNFDFSHINRVFTHKCTNLSKLPGKPLAYWAELDCDIDYVELGNSWGELIRGPELFDLNQDMRCWWEVRPDDIGIKSKWNWYAKGGEFKRYSTDIHLVINHKKQQDGGAVFRRPGDSKFYFLPGLTYTQRTTSDISFRVLPEGCYTSPKGPAIIAASEDINYAMLAICNTKKIQNLVNLRVGASGAAARSYDLGIIRELKIPQPSPENLVVFSELGKKCVELVSKLDLYDESHINFKEKKYFIDRSLENSYTSYCDLHKSVLQDLNSTRKEIEKNLKGNEFDEKEWLFPISFAEFEYSTLSMIIGQLFGRWGGDTSRSEIDSHFSKVKLCSRNTTKPEIYEAGKLAEEINYWLDKNCPARQKDEENFSISNLLNALSNTGSFFSFHLQKYSKSRRQAPIYWPLQTPSSSYTLWIYYHRLDEQTLYTCVNDFVDPKLQQVEKDLNALQGKSPRSSQEEKELAKLTDLTSELRDFRDELLGLAKVWKPNLNDGVQITAAPLWKLFQHKAWQKKLKETWQKLEKGDYDWALLACSIWPERVLRKCHQDRSLAIAHDVEDHFWHEVEVPVKRGKKLTGDTKLEWQPKDLSDSALNELVKQLIAESD
ncbi:BREX-1 system adenine-specific DNA-methyltransferase PglX [Endozoicomonas sp. 8E]|uniref:BREX-1 system adenine-specific DNA-methyltransferase PglX n=1 Tax=Endozoicomonas sp. 8E TaxID=3035692 RepID=UPI002939505A|nr:BREX-1 system adenine-specific DNA-methyltransferase PglX [Endozoicomonas sp. 8E]WOG28768.1 BREX-1 system adenine-specific DNA-methyltransferase PglX [Endozoicomonas sp. 8E]